MTDITLKNTIKNTLDIKTLTPRKKDKKKHMAVFSCSAK